MLQKCDGPVNSATAGQSGWIQVQEWVSFTGLTIKTNAVNALHFTLHVKRHESLNKNTRVPESEHKQAKAGP